MSKSGDPNRMVTIHGGPAWDVELLAMQLEEEGIACFLPDKMSKAMDPFITGANPLETRLQVRAVDAARAKDIVEKARESLRPAALEGDDFDEDDDLEDEETARDQADESTPREEVEYLASRTRWAAIFGLMTMGLSFPFAILTGWFYIRVSRDYGVRAQAHGMTLAAFWFSLVAVVGFALIWWSILG